VPRNLNDLCVRLLRRDAKTRPAGREVLRVLGSAGPSFRRRRWRRPLKAPSSAVSSRPPNCTTLSAPRAKARPSFVYVHGNSGMGKTELVRTFLDQLKQKNRSAIFLQGRCYERESVPYKALDGVVDSLSKHLASLRRAKAEELMPQNRAALARVFPVMLQVDAIFDARSGRPGNDRLVYLAAPGLRSAARVASPTWQSKSRW